MIRISRYARVIQPRRGRGTMVMWKYVQILEKDIEDLKGRLGLTSEGSASMAFQDWSSIRSLVTESWQKLRAGIDFYAVGTKLMIDDVAYAVRLVSRAAKVGLTHAILSGADTLPGLHPETPRGPHPSSHGEGRADFDPVHHHSDHPPLPRSVSV